MLDLDRAWIDQLIATWRDLNARFFRRALKLPSIALSDGESRLGYWQPASRQISIARRLLREQSWGVVIEVLKHEMAHQYVNEALNVHDEAAHGPAFRDVCQRLGIDPAAAGVPVARDADTGPERVRLLQRVTKLLALAESQNRHEAEAAMGVAQRLMLEHNLSAVSSGPRGYGFRELGRVKGRVFEPERRVGCLLTDYFFVEAIWVPSYDAARDKEGRVLEVCGAPENLDMAEYVHGFLHHTAERLWREHKAAHGIDGDRERIAFLAGVVQGFEETLAAKKEEHAEVGLVWVGDADLTRYYRARHPHVRTTRHAGAQGGSRAHGVAAGRKIVLHKPLHQRSGDGSPKLLGR